MNVMMIGHSGAGKTTYMTAMYELLSNGINGFSIKARDTDLHKRLLVLSNEMKKGRYPAATDIHTEYCFQLQHNRSDVLPFTWYDYRGGALTQRNEHSSEVTDLVNRVAAANALIVFFDGDKLMKNDYSVMMEYRITQICIQQAVSKIKDNGFIPISLVITKGDRPDLDIGKSPMLEYIQKMVAAIGENENVGGLMTATIVNYKEVENVQFPFLISMVHGLVHERNKAAEEYEEQTSRAKSWSDSANLFDDIYSFFAEEDSYREMAKKAWEKARDNYHLYEKLVESTNSIVKMLEQAAAEERILLL